MRRFLSNYFDLLLDYICTNKDLMHMHADALARLWLQGVDQPGLSSSTEARAHEGSVDGPAMSPRRH